MAKVLFHLGHPAHFHLFKNVIQRLKSENHTPIVVIKKKDVLENLLIEAEIPFHNILPEGKSEGRFGLVKDLLIRGTKLIRFANEHKPVVLIGTSPDIGYTGKLLGIPNINVNEDDANVVPLYAKMAYPLATEIISPTSCNNGKWQYKTISYQGYHELAYLHPDFFTPERNVVLSYLKSDTPFFILRFSSLNAHHDIGVKGVSNEMIHSLVAKLKPYGRVLITSERSLDERLNPFLMKIRASDMHHFLAFSEIVIGDSQTMSAEAAVLGTPYIRYNDFVGRIGYLNELEHIYKLGFGFKTGTFDEVLKCVDTILAMDKSVFNNRKELMLANKKDTGDVIYRSILKYLYD
jgi:predicted glycosyltransferase